MSRPSHRRLPGTLATCAALALGAAHAQSARAQAAPPLALQALPLYNLCANGTLSAVSACASFSVFLDPLPFGAGTEVSVWMRSLEGSPDFTIQTRFAPTAPFAGLFGAYVHFATTATIADESGNAILNRGTNVAFASTAGTANNGASTGAGWGFVSASTAAANLGDPTASGYLWLKPFSEPFETLIEGCSASIWQTSYDVLHTCDGLGAMSYSDPRNYARFRFSTPQLLSMTDITGLGFVDYAGDPDPNSPFGGFAPVGCDVAPDDFAVSPFIGGNACARLGATQWPPVLPSSLRPGTGGQAPAFIFDGAQTGLFYDPPNTWGYAYDALTPATLFTRVGLPAGFAQPFDIWTGAGNGTLLGHFAGGTLVDFAQLAGGPVTRFRITGINPLTDSTDPVAFPVQLFFDQPENNDFAMTPITITASPEPATLALLGGGLLALAAVRRRRPRR